MQDNLKLYVRGFFGSRSLSSETVQTHKQRPLLSIFDLNPEALQHVVCNESVVEIYNQLIRRHVISTDFDFRERAIKIALTAFGVKNFATWAKTCAMSSPTFTQTHADFIIDTVRYITTGKRDIPITTWERLIGPGTNDPTNKIIFDGNILSNLPVGFSILRNQRTEHDLPNIISKWLSHPGGFTDMVITLYTLFGEYNTR